MKLTLEKAQTLLDAGVAKIRATPVGEWELRPVGGVLTVCEYDATTGQGVIHFRVINGRLARDQEREKTPVNFLGVACAKIARLLANPDMAATTNCELTEVRFGEAPFAGGVREGGILAAFSGGPPELDERIALAVVSEAVEKKQT